MRPIYKIFVDNLDITSQIKDKVESITITDKTGTENDELEIIVEDDPPIAFPTQGVIIDVYMGYAKGSNYYERYQDISRYMGRFKVNEYHPSKDASGGKSLTIKANAVNFAGPIKETKNKVWENTTVGEIVNSIALSNGLTAKVDEKLINIAVNYLAQSSQSDFNFLYNLANSYQAVSKITNDLLYFSRRERETSISGKPLDKIVIYENECSQYDATIQVKSKYTGVSAKFRDDSNAVTNTVVAGEEGVVKEIRKIYPDEASAYEGAQNLQQNLNREEETMNITCIGNPDIKADRTVVLKNFRPGIRQEWVVSGVTHTMKGDYTTTIELEVHSAKKEASYSEQTDVLGIKPKNQPIFTEDGQFIIPETISAVKPVTEVPVNSNTIFNPDGTFKVPNDGKVN